VASKLRKKKCGCETIISILGDPEFDKNWDGKDISVSCEIDYLCQKHKDELLLKKWAGHHIVVNGNDYGLVVAVAQENNIRCLVTDKEYAIPYAAYLNYRITNCVDEDGEKLVHYPDGTRLSKSNVGPKFPERRKRSYPN